MKVNRITLVIQGSILIIFSSPTLLNCVSSSSLSEERADLSRIAREKLPWKLLVREPLINTRDSVSQRLKPAPVLRIRDRTRANASPGEHHRPKPTRLPDVSVTCSRTNFVLRVRKSFYGFSAVAEELTLGDSCRSNGVPEPKSELIFTYDLDDCQSQRQVFPDYVVYKYVLRYESLSKQGSLRRHRIHVGVECRYKRDVFSPVVRPTQRTLLHKILKSRSGDFRMQLMDDSWSSPVRSAVYTLGQKVNVQVSTERHHHRGARLFINSCYAAAVNTMNEANKYSLIDNYGCLQESRINPSASRFRFSGADNVVQFSFGAFQFTQAPDAQISLHCELSVSAGAPTSMQKACFYSQTEKRWISVFGHDSVCDCCKSVCNQTKPKQVIYEEFNSTLVTHLSDDVISFLTKPIKVPLSSYTHNDFVASITLVSSEEDHSSRQHKSLSSRVELMGEGQHGDVEVLRAVIKSSGGFERPDLDPVEQVKSASGDGMMQDMIKDQRFGLKKAQHVEEAHQEVEGFMKMPVMVNSTMENHPGSDESAWIDAHQHKVFPSLFLDEKEGINSSDNKEEVLDFQLLSTVEATSDFPVESEELVEQDVIRKLDDKRDSDDYYFSDMDVIQK